MRRLESNTGLRRTSLELKVQDDAIFIIDYGVHGPWNIMEHEGRNMTKGKTRRAKSVALGDKHL